MERLGFWTASAHINRALWLTHTMFTRRKARTEKRARRRVLARRYREW